ncbi:MAG: transcriptional repressor [Patescibacteria group bacterium]|nr:transcriptional repressor [Patescibacteria group bacterium]
MITNKKEKLTSQKKLILDYLRSVKTHPSAKEIFKTIRKKLPRISLSTVYRILNNLKEKNQIFEIPIETSRFDGDLSPHAHFICQKCRKIFDIFEKLPSLRIKKIKIGFVKNYQIYFYGLCQKCQK